jgi:hypothetical protein
LKINAFSVFHSSSGAPAHERCVKTCGNVNGTFADGIEAPPFHGLPAKRVTAIGHRVFRSEKTNMSFKHQSFHDNVVFCRQTRLMSFESRDMDKMCSKMCAERLDSGLGNS